MDIQIDNQVLEEGVEEQTHVNVPGLGAEIILVNVGYERSIWQHVAYSGRLCRRPPWRWCGRLEAGTLAQKCGKCHR